MAKLMHRLSALKVQNLQKEQRPGMYPDGGGLYLKIMPTGSRWWQLRYMLAGRARYL